MLIHWFVVIWISIKRIAWFGDFWQGQLWSDNLFHPLNLLVLWQRTNTATACFHVISIVSGKGQRKKQSTDITESSVGKACHTFQQAVTAMAMTGCLKFSSNFGFVQHTIGSVWSTKSFFLVSVPFCESWNRGQNLVSHWPHYAHSITRKKHVVLLGQGQRDAAAWLRKSWWRLNLAWDWNWFCTRL